MFKCWHTWKSLPDHCWCCELLQARKCIFLFAHRNPTLPETLDTPVMQIIRKYVFIAASVQGTSKYPTKFHNNNFTHLIIFFWAPRKLRPIEAAFERVTFDFVEEYLNSDVENSLTDKILQMQDEICRQKRKGDTECKSSFKGLTGVPSDYHHHKYHTGTCYPLHSIKT